tara:strand:+ start:79 stop:966 length:888 start_codon:yes stop_codon:yes gene_type:complete
MNKKIIKTLPIGFKLKDYTILSKIALGGFSNVYLASDKKNKIVAIKEFFPRMYVSRSEKNYDINVLKVNSKYYKISLKYFFNEAKILSSTKHSNIVKVLNFFKAHNTVYMVTLYEKGSSLINYINYKKKQNVKPLLSEIYIRKVFSQISNALFTIHKNKLLYLDLKPANIFLRVDGTPILLDFGAARKVLYLDIEKFIPMYTHGYAAPEIYLKKNLGPWTDIYGIGASIFTCMVGLPPPTAIERGSFDKMENYYKILTSIYSESLVDLVRRCLSINYLNRPKSLLVLHKEIHEKL